jgi:hypothetical protein
LLFLTNLHKKMARFEPIAVLALVLAVVGAQPACDPLVPERCALPFPSDFFRGADGWLNFTNAVFPLDNKGHPIDANGGGWTDLDGFSPLTSIQAYFPDLGE